MVRQFSDLRVLVVDDNLRMRAIVGEILGAAGIRNLRFSPDGQDALRVLTEFQPDVCIVDHEMPASNGLQFLSAVRNGNPAIRYLPIIMLTGHSDMRRLVAARDLGVNEFLSKPVTARTLLTRIHAAVSSPRAFVEGEAYNGPDRRRRPDPNYSGPRRRKADQQDTQESASHDDVAGQPFPSGDL
jgi:CheY-like chemotaxis protein